MACQYCNDAKGFNSVKNDINSMMDPHTEWNDDRFESLINRLSEYAYRRVNGWYTTLYFIYEGGLKFKGEDGTWHNDTGFKFRYCPMCGRKLED